MEDALRRLFAHLPVPCMAPPDQHVRLSQRLLGAALLRLIQVGDLRDNLPLAQLVQPLRNGSIQAVGIDLLRSMRRVLIPHQNTHLLGFRHEPCSSLPLDAVYFENATLPPCFSERGILSSLFSCFSWRSWRLGGSIRGS